MSMETATWFKMFLFLVVVGVAFSLMPGGASMPVFNATLNITALQDPPTACSSWVPFWCAVTDSATATLNLIWTTLSFIWQGLVFLAEAVAFFTGISALFSGALIPAPLSVIIGVVVIFMWLFLAVDIAGRIIGVVSGVK